MLSGLRRSRDPLNSTSAYLACQGDLYFVIYPVISCECSTASFDHMLGSLLGWVALVVVLILVWRSVAAERAWVRRAYDVEEWRCVVFGYKTPNRQTGRTEGWCMMRATGEAMAVSSDWGAFDMDLSR